MRLNHVMPLWRSRLSDLLVALEERKRRTRHFYLKVFLFFIALNVVCYWIAMISAFPDVAFGPERGHYFWVQIPVGVLGAVFDALSLFVTLYMVRRALTTTSHVSYVAHLSVDIAIAALATLWVLFVFSFSGWLVSMIAANPESLVDRGGAYQDRLVNALRDPTGQEELRNIYFGILMGLSAMLPTLTHLYLSVHTVGTVARRSAQAAARLN
ncbi:MAG: hypothetical protein O3C65_07490 [Proteobacteria bacterium]|nr:hypothetical protein [Pseudomonadota bacterium]MDA1058517.1 hypothetical protein [Pseudomonadota bacterium]